MNVNIEKKRYLFALLVIIVILIFFVLGLFSTMKKPRGLIIHAPVMSNSNQNLAVDYAEKPNKQLLSLSPASFASLFGVKLIKEKKVQAKAKPKPIKKKQKKIIKLKPKPKALNLTSFGYRLTGLIKGENNDTVAFIYDPLAKKNRIVRQSSSDTIQIINTWLRKIEVRTPKGQGILELKNSKGLKSSMALPSRTGLSNSTTPAVDLPPSANSQPKPPQSPYRPPNISNMLSSGKLKTTFNRRTRGLGMKVNSLPSELKDYQLQKGDIIIGDAQKQFHSLNDARQVFRQIHQRPTILRIQRGKKTIFVRPELKQGSPNRR